MGGLPLNGCPSGFSPLASRGQGFDLAVHSLIFSQHSRSRRWPYRFRRPRTVPFSSSRNPRQRCFRYRRRRSLPPPLPFGVSCLFFLYVWFRPPLLRQPWNLFFLLDHSRVFIFVGLSYFLFLFWVDHRVVLFPLTLPYARGLLLLCDAGSFS